MKIKLNKKMNKTILILINVSKLNILLKLCLYSINITRPLVDVLKKQFILINDKSIRNKSFINK